MKRGIFFDLYGTLIDIVTDEYDPWVYATLSRYLSYHLVRIGPDQLRRAYFDDIQAALKNNGGPCPEVDVYEIFSNIMERCGERKYAPSAVADAVMLFRSLTLRRFNVFAGVYETLGSLAERGELGLISYAQWVFAEPEMEMLDLSRFFKSRVLSSRFGFKKPDTRMFDIAMRNTMTRPEESVYIGDNPQKDLVGAKKAGMKFILFRGENRAYDGFQPDRHFTDYSELAKILEDI